MSVSFTQVAVGHARSPIDVLRDLGQDLLPLQLTPDGLLFRIDRDVEDEGYTDGESLGVSLLSAYSSPDAFGDPPGLGTAFRGDHAEIVARVARQSDGTMICFVDMSDRTLYGYFRRDEAAALRALLASSARACNAEASFGAMEIEWKPYTEAAIRDAIVHGPEGYEGQPPPYGLFRMAHVPSTEPEQFSAQQFEAFSTPDYWILQRRGLEAVFGSLLR